MELPARLRGKKKGKHSPALRTSLPAAKLERALVPSDDLVANPESKPITGVAFGGEEGMEDFLSGLLAHSLPCIGNGKDQPLAA